MQKKITKDDIEFKLFQDFWRIRQEFYEPKSEEDFEKVTMAVEIAMKPYKGTHLEKFANDLFMAHLSDADRRDRERRENGK